jgi:hypothetical protein
MLELIDFDLDELSPEVAKGVNTLERMRAGYHYGWLQAITIFKGVTMDDIPVYQLSGRSGLHTRDDLIDYCHRYMDTGFGVIIKDADGVPAGILYGIEDEQREFLGLW